MGKEVAPADVRKLEGALHHAPGRVAVVGEDARAEGAVIGANAHRPVQALALLHERREGLPASDRALSVWMAMVAQSPCIGDQWRTVTVSSGRRYESWVSSPVKGVPLCK